MKKFFKFIAGVASVAALACGAYYFFKKYVCKETADEDFDDFDDDLDDYDTDDSSDVSDSREYVSINITSDQDEKSADTTEENVSNEDTLTEESTIEEP